MRQGFSKGLVGVVLVVGVPATALLARVDEESIAAAPAVAAPPEAPRQHEKEPEPTEVAADLTMSAKVSEGRDLRTMFIDVGIDAADASAAARLLEDALGSRALAGQTVLVEAGVRKAGGKRPLIRAQLAEGSFTLLAVTRVGSGFRLLRESQLAEASPQRFRGKAGANLYWSLRATGVPASAAEQYMEVIGQSSGSGRVDPEAEFDLVVESWRRRDGARQDGNLVYAGLSGTTGRLTLVRWAVDGEHGWFDPSRASYRTHGLEWPTHGRVSSSFGGRLHPILRFFRFHNGTDIAAPRGAPVRAAADGIVASAGWSGGYGKQVRLAHGAVETGYAHLSEILVAPGSRVSRGQLIGRVGSTGFSTGPHLHYTVRQNGREVDPQSFRPAFDRVLTQADMLALRVRRDQLLSI